MKNLSWLSKVIILGISTIAVGMVPVFALMWANYHFDPNVCWPNEYGGWYIVPMIFIGAGWGLGANIYLERKLRVCDHDYQK
tara:strand:- start:359 stop:604 length:246 start_codon:yes stop_codon:yes gene_type:complete